MKLQRWWNLSPSEQGVKNGTPFLIHFRLIPLFYGIDKQIGLAPVVGHGKVKSAWLL